MAWVYVKRPDEKHIHYITEEAFEATFREQGFELVQNATEDDVDVNKQSVQPTPEKPRKRQYNKRSEA